VHSNLRQGTVLMWLLVAAIIIAVGVGAILFLVKVKGVNPITNLGTGTAQSTSTSVQSVSSSDAVGDIQNELKSTSFDSIDSDLQQTSKDLSSL